jgi:tetratricopeptide (TPR) repeat protein
MASTTIYWGRAQPRIRGVLAAVVCLMFAAAPHALAAVSGRGAEAEALIKACFSARGPQGRPGKRGRGGPPGPPGKNGKAGGSVESKVIELAKIVGAILGGIVTAVLTAYVLVLLLLHVLTRLPLIKDLPPARWVRRPNLMIETLNDRALPNRLGPAITGLLRGRVSIYRDRYGLELVSGQQAVATALTSFKDLSGSTQTAFALVRFLNNTLPRRRFTLCGELQPPGARGVGIALALRREDGYDSLEVLWAKPLQVADTGASAYQSLTVPAAAWVDHRLTRALKGKLLSRDPLSWAFFRAGMERHRLGDIAAARSLYEQALGHDGRNVGALADLGVIERREGNFERAKKLLQDARNTLREAERSKCKCKRIRKPLDKATQRLADRVAAVKRRLCIDVSAYGPTLDWYRIRYQLAALSVAEADRTLRDPKRTDEERAWQLNSAFDTALNVAREVAKRVERFGQTDSQITQLLRSTIEPAALVLLASAWVLLHGAPAYVPATRARTLLHRELVELLELSSPDVGLLIQFVQQTLDLAPRVYYNLACFSMRVKRPDQAVELLRLALRETPLSERRALRDVIAKDPTLEELRERVDFLDDAPSVP